MASDRPQDFEAPRRVLGPKSSSSKWDLLVYLQYYRTRETSVQTRSNKNVPTKLCILTRCPLQIISWFKKTLYRYTYIYIYAAYYDLPQPVDNLSKQTNSTFLGWLFLAHLCHFSLRRQGARWCWNFFVHRSAVEIDRRQVLVQSQTPQSGLRLHGFRLWLPRPGKADRSTSSKNGPVLRRTVFAGMVR